jgi:hypothetical protein
MILLLWILIDMIFVLIKSLVLDTELFILGLKRACRSRLFQINIDRELSLDSNKYLLTVGISLREQCGTFTKVDYYICCSFFFFVSNLLTQ